MIANRIADHINGDMLIYKKGIFEEIFKEYDAIIPIFAIGIVIREIAGLLNDKWSDPAIVVVDSNLNFAIPIIGGHHGANTLAKKLSTLGALPVITTATEVHNLPSVEGIAEKLNCDILNKDSTKEVNCALLEMDVEVLEVIGPKILIVDSSVSVLKKKVGSRQSTVNSQLDIDC